MAQTKIYPSTQAQVQAVQNTVDEINSKIVTPNYQVKTVTPSNVQKTVQADLDLGYTALSGVVVNPIAALMPQTVEDYILRNNQGVYFSLNLNGAIPAYACYGQGYLSAIYGAITSIGDSAFYNCSSLESVDTSHLTSIGTSAFYNCSSLKSLDIRNMTTIGGNALQYIGATCIDARGLTNAPLWGFTKCANLRFLDVRNVSEIGRLCFDGCYVIKLIDFTNQIVPPTIASDTFKNTNNQFWAVFADDTIKAAVQSATNWSAIASQIYTVAEIEALVGMTYDEYYLQCFGHPRND